MKKICFVLVALGLFFSTAHVSNAYYPDENSEKKFRLSAVTKSKPFKATANKTTEQKVENKIRFGSNAIRARNFEKTRRNEISIPSDLSEYKNENSDSEVHLSKFERYCVSKILLPFQVSKSTEVETNTSELKEPKTNDAIKTSLKSGSQKKLGAGKSENGMELPTLHKRKNLNFKSHTPLSKFESNCVDKILQISSDAVNYDMKPNEVLYPQIDDRGSLTKKNLKQDSDTTKPANTVILPVIGK